MLISLSLVSIWVDVIWLGGSWEDWFQPTPVISLLGLVGGFGALLWQLEVQHLNLLEANRKQSQDNLKLDIYKEIAARIETTYPPFAEASTAPLLFMIELKRFRDYNPSGRPGTAMPETKYTFRYFQDVEKSATDSILGLVSILSVYEIAMREFEVFRMQFSRQTESFQKSISSFALEASFYSRKDEVGPLKWPPTDDDLQRLDEMGKAAISAATGLTGTVEDLRVESQNILMGALSPGWKAKPRKPGDPNVRVTTAELSQD